MPARRTVLGLGLAFLLLGGMMAPPAPGDEAAPASPPAGQPAAEGEQPLAVTQEIISRRFRRFEDGLYRIAESIKRSDPDRADLLLRAIGKSKEERISAQMNELVQLLRDNKQLGDAIEQQDGLIGQLQALLDLLLSEDRQKELKEEQKRIKGYIDEVNKIIGKEKGNRADNERGLPADDVAGQQKKIADQTEGLNKKIAQDDAAKQARSQASGSKSSNSKSDPKGGQSNPQEGEPKEGDSKSGDSKEGDASPGDSKEGEPKEGDTKGTQAPSGKPDGTKPNAGDPKARKPSDAQPGQPGEGQPQEGQPQEGQPNQGQPSQGQEGSSGKPTPGREELEKAKQAMERAIENLKKNKRHDASDDQDDALTELQKAKEKLEEILRQLREEERERFLAMLEARFQRMLAMQLLVYDGTVKLSRTSEVDRSTRHSARSLQLARQEEEIALEATKAITLLREEGTAVAFPEAVEQMRDDMRTVAARLERTEVGELTQAIERDIIDALEEMIDALQKEMEKSKDKDKSNQPQDGQQSDPPLVDQLAELKMLRTLQLRINNRTRRLGRLIEGEQANDPDVIGQLQQLSGRQARVQRATYDIATGRNK